MAFKAFNPSLKNTKIALGAMGSAMVSALGIYGLFVLFDSEEQKNSSSLPIPKWKNIQKDLQVYDKDFALSLNDKDKRFATILSAVPIKGIGSNDDAHTHEILTALADQKNPSIGMIKQFEGYSATLYPDGNHHSIGFGMQVYPQGAKPKQEKIFTDILKTPYINVVNGSRKVNENEATQLTKGYLSLPGNADYNLHHMMSGATKHTGKNCDYNAIAPLHRAALNTVMYQSPAAFISSDDQNYRPLTYPHIAVVASPNTTKEDKEESMEKLISFHAAKYLLNYTHDKSHDPKLWGRDKALINAVTEKPIATPLMAMVMHKSVQNNKNPTRVIIGYPTDSIEKMITSPLAQWHQNQSATFVAPELHRVYHVNKGQVTSFDYTMAGDTMRFALPPESMHGTAKTKGQLLQDYMKISPVQHFAAQ